MPLDTSIPLSVRPAQFMSPADAISLQNLSRQAQLGDIQLRQATQADDERMAAQRILGVPGAIDQNGRISQQALSELAKSNPQLALKYQQEQAKVMREAMEKVWEKATPESRSAFVASGGTDWSVLMPRVKREMVNAGGVTVPVDPYTQTEPIPHTMTPGETERATWARFTHANPSAGDLIQASISAAGQNKPQYDEGRGAWITRPNPTGVPRVTTATPPPVGGVPLNQIGGQAVNPATPGTVPLNAVATPAAFPQAAPRQAAPAAPAAAPVAPTVAPKAASTAIKVEGLPPKQSDLRAQQEDLDKLRQEFEGRDGVKAYRSVVPIAEAARQAPDTRAGDIQMAYTVGKILDPGSVVREGELKLVGNAAPIMEKVEGELRTLVYGKGRLTPETRKQLMDMLDVAVGERRKSYETERTSFEGIVKKRGYDPTQVFINTPGQPAAKGGPANLSPQEQSELAALRKRFNKGPAQ